VVLVERTKISSVIIPSIDGDHDDDDDDGDDDDVVVDGKS